jgi:Methyltransferase FkbM domain
MGYPHPAIDDLLLDSVNQARHRYVIAQLGARRGTYLIKSSRLLVKFRPSLDSTFIGVEASPSGYFDLLRSMERNGLNGRSNIFRNVAISDTITSVKFLENGVSSHIVKATKDIPTICHSGQGHNWKRKVLISLPLIFERLSGLKMPKNPTPHSKSLSQRFPKDTNVVEVESTTIEEVLKDVSHVDFLEMDIQGAEYRSIPCASEILSEKVRMICVRTHGARADEETLHNVFRNLRWQEVLVCYNQTPVVIKEKEVPLNDGIHCWVNTNLREPCSLNFSHF